LKSNKNKPGFISKLKERAANLQRDVYALWFAYRDARTPWYAKGFAALVLGYLDDLILVPAGIALALKMIPAEVMSDARVKAGQHLKDKKPTNWVVAGVIILIWIAILAWVGITIWNAFPRK
jgi:uncharacterized membrane protein YkvA (DUF1232 family)